MDKWQMLVVIVGVTVCVNMVVLTAYHTWFGLSNRVDYKMLTDEFEMLRQQVHQEFNQNRAKNTILRNLTNSGRKIVRQEILPGVVYFIADAKSKMVKIGYTTNIANRLSQLQVSHHSKLEVLATIPGDENLESQLHRQFKKQRAEGEWFRVDTELAGYINEIIQLQQTEESY